MSDTVRALRLIEYVGPRYWVERQIRDSIHGTKIIHGRGRITAVTIGEFVESIAELGVSDASGRSNKD